MKAKEDPWWGGIEAGGTKFVCAIGRGPKEIVAHERFATTTPQITLEQVRTFFAQHTDRYPLRALGIGSFGPLDADPHSSTFGTITTTPKPGWSHTELAGFFRRTLALPVAFDTDVNAAALAEHQWGAGRGVQNLVYVTVGTGIGGGALLDGAPLHGFSHPEMGHMRLARHKGDTSATFPGVCPFHQDCWEGLASGPAMEARWGQSAQELPPEHPAWELEAFYLASGLMNIALILSPQRIILGGGVAQQRHLLERVRQNLGALLGNYVQGLQTRRAIRSFLVPPALGQRAGVLGAIALAQRFTKREAKREAKRCSPDSNGT